MSVKTVLLYFIRWQASTPLAYLCLWLLSDIPLLYAVIISNIIGASIFIFVDKYLFGRKQ